ncbi:MAG: hemopexin repeat-containing protein [Cellulomonas sp.]
MTAKRVYFFSGTTYSRYDTAIDNVLPIYPLVTAASWTGLPATIDAALNWGNGKVYFFSGAQYYRFDVLLDAVDPGYPRAIAGAWTDAASSAFDSGIDAAVNWGNGKAYLFKGGQYIRHDIAADTLDPGYPKPIKGNWPGVDGTIFEKDVDDVVNYGNGKVYWFKGDCYARVDQAAKSFDAGYPKLISAAWPGVFPAGITAAVEWPMAAVQPAGFRVPENRAGCQQVPTGTGSRFGERFEMNIDFDGAPYPTTCAVGEYRQYVRGQFRVNGAVKTHLLADPRGGPAPAMLPAPAAGATGDNFQQDGIQLPAGGAQLFYGHRRGQVFPTSQFTPDFPTGCAFRGIDNPGISSSTGNVLSVNLDFRGDAVDSASSTEVLQTSSWSVSCGGTA